MTRPQSPDPHKSSRELGKIDAADQKSSATPSTEGLSGLASVNSAKSAPLRWEGMLEALKNEELTPGDRTQIASEQLTLAGALFDNKDERLARANLIMAQEMLTTGALDKWEILAHLRAANTIYHQVDKKGRSFHPERLASEIQIVEMFRDNISMSDVAREVSEAFKNAFGMLEDYVVHERGSGAAKFQALMISHEASDFYLNYRDDASAAASRCLRLMAKIAGMEKPKNVEEIEQLKSWKPLPSMLKAPMLGVLADYYEALGEGFEDEKLRCIESQINQFKYAIESQEKLPGVGMRQLFGDETTLLGELRRGLVDALNRVGEEYFERGLWNDAQHSFVEALSIPVPATGRYHRDSLEWLHALAEEHEDGARFGEAAGIHEAIAKKLMDFQRPVLALDHIGSACNLYAADNRYEQAGHAMSEALTVLSQLDHQDSVEVQSCQARLLWARVKLEGNLQEDVRMTDEQLDEVYETMLRITRQHTFEDSAHIHLYSLACKSAPLIWNGELEEARPLLLEAYNLLAGEEGRPEGINPDLLPRLYWGTGASLMEHSTELAELGLTLFARGIDELDQGEDVKSADYYPFLKSQAQCAVILERGQDEALRTAEYALTLFREPYDQDRAESLVELMETRAELLEQLGRYAEVEEVNREIIEFREKHNLEDADDDD